MKKYLSRIAVLMLTLAMVLTSVLAAYADTDSGSSDSDQTEEHTHSYGEWTVTIEPTHFEKGKKVRVCSCGKTQTKSVAILKSRSEWVRENDKSYYFDKNGDLFTGWHRMKPRRGNTTRWIYFDQDGVCRKILSKNTRRAWVRVDGSRFYFTTKKRPAGEGFNTIGGKLYHMDSTGAVMTGKFKAVDGKTYRTRKDGVIRGLYYLKYKYSTFICIDISSQRLRFYKNGKHRMTADVVTGTRNKHDTPTGTFSVRSKQRNVNLVGPTWNAHVSYWMAFLGSSYGMHDATWRSSAQFSNHKTYISNGSHGCVNMRYSQAKKLYKMVRVGTPVIVQK